VCVARAHRGDTEGRIPCNARLQGLDVSKPGSDPARPTLLGDANILWYQAYILWVGRKQQGGPVSVPTIQYPNYICIEKLTLCCLRGVYKVLK